MAHRAF